MRRVKNKAQAIQGITPHRVITFDMLFNEWQEDLNFLIMINSDTEIDHIKEINQAGIENVGWIYSSDEVMDGDVIIPNQSVSGHIVLYRESDRHHVVQVTNRCNSRCLMCSQPPTNEIDLWMYEEAFLTVKHIRNMPDVLGISGGEPLILGDRIRILLEYIHSRRKDTYIEILTNGRYLAYSKTVNAIFNKPLPNVSWLVPLYGHCDFMHDYVVQSTGAFQETIAGLLQLQKNQQPIQLRIVLIKPVLENLTELCAYIGRNLPFVREVSFMGCESIGYALANKEECSVDLSDWKETLISSAKILERFRVPLIIMNAPLCSLPVMLYKYAHKSISDWKNVYVDECERCILKDQCCGLFAWHEKGWKPTKIQAFEEMV